ncbi:DUF3369 domain-containing protein [Alteromonas sp. H39]|uniref:DUF3369 domain-containing protein n=1 Tax=Alteromonas sp. H39 TaxID=3389876 RepID=UPI0039E05ECE
MFEDELVFASDEISDNVISPKASWKILVVDDEEEVHHVTRIVLSEFLFDGREVSLTFASSAKEARNLLSNDKNREFAVAIVDVVMETSQAGLELVQWIRDEQQNHLIRLILRTGQPGEAPEESVIRDYDINDYKNKTELTAMRLKASIFSALRGYRDIKIIERHRQGLEKIIAASVEFIECDTLSQFASAILNQISVVLNIESNPIVCCAVVPENQKYPDKIKVLAANTGAEVVCNTQLDTLAPSIQRAISKALANKASVHNHDEFVGYFTTSRGTENILYVAHDEPLEAVQHHLLDYFANHIAVAHESLKLRETIRESQKELSYVIGEAVEMRSKETGSHVKRVAHISHLLAGYYGVPDDQAEMIKLASPLHDVGKVGIPDTILNKPGKHAPDETEIMQKHAEIGYEMLIKSDNPILQLGAQIAYQHHENWDGSGYPRGLSGKNIHVAGRISAVADVFDALGSRRCYKGPWNDDEIVEYFRANRGIRFEPELVDILLDHFDEFAAIKQAYPDDAQPDFPSVD